MDVSLRKRTAAGYDPPVPISGAEFVVGRGASCQLRVDSPEVSDRHCVIRTQGDRVVIDDLASTLGTVVNDRQILEPVEVRDGDTLRVGPSQFVFRVAAA